MGPITPVARHSFDPVVLVERYLPKWLIQRLSTLFGLWTAVAPLLLWIAWPPRVWIALFWSGMVALLLTGIFTAALMPTGSTLRRREAESSREKGPWDEAAEQHAAKEKRMQQQRAREGS